MSSPHNASLGEIHASGREVDEGSGSDGPGFVKGRKARTGCTTCKRRRVKCDEERPTCRRCRRFGVQCEGYEVVKSAAELRREKLEAPVPPLRAISPRLSNPASGGTVGQSSHHAQHVQTIGIPVELPATAGSSGSDQDALCVQFYRQKMAHCMVPFFRSEFWERSCLRDTAVNECVRSAVLSLGANGLLAWSEQQGALDSGLKTSAWRYCGRALALLREAVVSNGHDNRLLMMATLLIITLQNLQGHVNSATSLIETALRMFMDASNDLAPPYLRRLLEGRPYSEAGSAVVSDDAEVHEMLQLYGQHAAESAQLHSSLDQVDTPSLVPGVAVLLAYRPADLISADQCHGIWSLAILPRVSTFSRAVARSLIVRSGAGHSIPALQLERTQLSGLMSDFANVLARLQPPGSGTGPASTLPLLQLAYLQIRLRAAAILVDCCLDTTERAYDGRAAEFRRLVADIEPLWAHLAALTESRAHLEAAPGRIRSRSAVVGPATGTLFPVLGLVAIKGRAAPDARRKAVEMLSAAGWREGRWDGGCLGDVLEGLVGLEQGRGESNRQGKEPEPADLAVDAESRWCWSGCAWDDEARVVKVEFRRLLPSSDGQWETTSRAVRL